MVKKGNEMRLNFMVLEYFLGRIIKTESWGSYKHWSEDTDTGRETGAFRYFTIKNKTIKL